MFLCCLPKRRGCRQRRAHPPNTSPHWAGPVRLPQCLRPFGKKNQKATDELGRRQEDTHSSLTPESPVLGRPPVPPRPRPAVLHWTAALDAEPTEAKSEATPVEELDPLPTSATPEAEMVSGITSGGDREPTGALVPAHGDADAVQGELAPAPAPTPASASPPSPAPARATPTSPAPACAPVLAPDPDPPLVSPLPRPLPVPLFLPQTQLLPFTLHRPSPLHLPQLLLLPLPLPLSLLLSLTETLPLRLPQTQLLLWSLHWPLLLTLSPPLAQPRPLNLLLRGSQTRIQGPQLCVVISPEKYPVKRGAHEPTTTFWQTSVFLRHRPASQRGPSPRGHGALTPCPTGTSAQRSIFPRAAHSLVLCVDLEEEVQEVKEGVFRPVAMGLEVLRCCAHWGKDNQHLFAFQSTLLQLALKLFHMPVLGVRTRRDSAGKTLNLHILLLDDPSEFPDLLFGEPIHLLGQSDVLFSEKLHFQFLFFDSLD
ncbi:proline-rich protein 36-like [Mustela erminea]|uniref:proline-rich protein 36-like n=1 Tax=Mustela erminea TaxID=36723 RepID=UPI0013871520|nr:proline-rich protein 36-like [Mustela erminea]